MSPRILFISDHQNIVFFPSSRARNLFGVGRGPPSRGPGTGDTSRGMELRKLAASKGDADFSDSSVAVQVRQTSGLGLFSGICQ